MNLQVPVGGNHADPQDHEVDAEAHVVPLLEFRVLAI